MKENLNTRLSQVFKEITKPNFLEGAGLANEIPFHIFDYPPEKELEVRDYLQRKLIPDLRNKHPDISFVTVNLFELAINHLKEQDYYDGVLDLQRDEDDEALAEAFDGVLGADTITDLIVEKQQEVKAQLILLTGVGSSWKMIHLNSVLSALQPKIERIPLIVFFPGEYTETGLKIFNEIEETSYYRAFKLVP